MKIWGSVKELFKQFGLEIGAEVVAEKLVGGNEKVEGKGAEKMARAVGQRMKSEAEYRDELFAFIGSTLMEEDREAAENLRRRHSMRQHEEKRTYKIGRRKPPYEPGDEDHFVITLGRLYKNIGNDANEKERGLRLTVFKWLGHMDDKEFDEALEFLTNDMLQQRVVKFFRSLQETFGRLIDRFPSLEEVANAIEKGLNSSANALENIDSWLANQSWVK